ncbi:MAG: outer membrane lipoprotein carrier protein LolA [Pseudomonadota bacterium]
MVRRRLLGLVLGALALVQVGSASAATELDGDQLAAVLRAEIYLNQIKSFQARFVQISSNGAFAEGEVFVDRPGKLRFEYDPPNPILLIADGINLLYYDKELKQSTFIPLWETPLWFLIRDQIDLSKGVEVTDVELAKGVIRMTLQEEDAGDAGAVTLEFSDKPFALRKWEVVDPQGITTQVALINPEFGVALDKKVFDYGDLDVHGLGIGGDR